LLAHAKSDIGKVRETNEDSFLCLPPLFVTAGPEILLERAVIEANSLILQLAQEKSECAGMGTTVTAVIVDGSKVYWSHVGDSRLYQLRAGHLSQVTEDHSLVSELVRSGSIDKEEAFHHPKRNILTRAVGTDEQVIVDSGIAEWFAGDKLLLCSDGLTNTVRDEEILAVIGSGASGDAAVNELVAMANNAGGFDNITLILVQHEGP